MSKLFLWNWQLVSVIFLFLEGPHHSEIIIHLYITKSMLRKVKL